MKFTGDPTDPMNVKAKWQEDLQSSCLSGRGNIQI